MRTPRRAPRGHTHKHTRTHARTHACDQPQTALEVLEVLSDGATDACMRALADAHSCAARVTGYRITCTCDRLVQCPILAAWPRQVLNCRVAGVVSWSASGGTRSVRVAWSVACNGSATLHTARVLRMPCMWSRYEDARVTYECRIDVDWCLPASRYLVLPVERNRKRTGSRNEGRTSYATAVP